MDSGPGDGDADSMPSLAPGTSRTSSRTFNDMLDGLEAERGKAAPTLLPPKKASGNASPGSCTTRSVRA